jgi:hypothetical protein
MPKTLHFVTLVPRLGLEATHENSVASKEKTCTDVQVFTIFGRPNFRQVRRI